MANEEAVGIFGFVGSHKGFSGVLKHRWEDFHVHEVDENGKILHLTELISRNEVFDQIKSKRHTDSGSGVICRNFSFSEETRHELLNVGFFSEEDVQIVEEFIHHLACVADAPPATQKDTLSGQYIVDRTESEEVTRETSIEQRDPKPKLLREKITIKSPPYCSIVGDFGRCVESLVQRYQREKSLTFPTLNQVWKELRRSIHCCTRNVLPFLCSDTSTLSELSASTGTHPDHLTSFSIPTVSPFIVHNPLIIQRLGNFKEHVTQVLQQHEKTFLSESSSSENTIDQFSRVIRLCPKPPALSLLFQHLRRMNIPLRDSSKKGVISNSEEKGQRNPFCSVEMASPCCSCSRRKQRNGRWRHDPVSVGPDGLCSVCKLVATREPRQAPHFERWPKDRPPYLYFHLWKSNRDTADAINMISQCLGCNPKIFSFGGTKDKRAVSVQAVTALKVSSEQLQKALIHPKWDRSVRVSNIRYQTERISLGSLQGNHFRICIRNVDPRAGELVREACDSLQTSGFINFFGLQRFGTRKIRTHQIGAAILQGHFEAAIRLILGDATVLGSLGLSLGEIRVIENELKLEETASNNSVHKKRHSKSHQMGTFEGDTKRRKIEENDHSLPQTPDKENCSTVTKPETETLLQCPSALYFVTGDANVALRTLPQHCYIERQVLKSLADDRHNYLRALQKLPKNVLTLHVHAAQSVVWNAVASYRIKEFGHQPVIGDFVLVNESPKGFTISTDLPCKSRSNVENMVQQHEESAPDKLEPEAGDFLLPSDIEFRVLRTPEDVAGASIFQVVLPLPGDKIQYPEYLLSIYQKSCRNFLGIELDEIKSNHRHRLGDYSGGYRHICVQPKNFQYHFIPSVANGTEKFLASDVDLLLNNDSVKRDQIRDPSFNPTPLTQLLSIKNVSASDPPSSEDALSGTAAVLVSCTLPKSAYLTMACRELFMRN